MTRVLVLRPEPGATATVRRARARGLDAIGIPLFEIEPVPWKAPEPNRFDGLLLTSANAVRGAGDRLHSLRGLPVYAVGEATADAAREAGFDIKSVGEDGIDRLLHSIEPELKLLHLCGEHRKAPSDPTQQIIAVTVYRASERDADLTAVRDAVALVHSPRAARRLAELVGDRDQIAIAAISEAAASAAGNGWQSVHFAESPNDDALLALAARLCNKSEEA
jgi:uroporphyrinogen-III synthase